MLGLRPVEPSRRPAPGPERLRLLASAIAGRPVEVVAASASDVPWTDGTTIHVPSGNDRAAEIRTVALHASLVAAGSLSPEVLRPLVRRPGLARRYLVVEGHRALHASESLLPAAARDLVDHRIASASAAPHESLEVARSGVALDEPPAWFGTLDPRRTLDAAERSTATTSAAAPREPETSERGLREIDDDEGDGYDVGDLLSSPVGGGGPIGRLLARLLAPTRRRGEGGEPGADAPTHVARARPGAARRPAVTARASAALDEVPPLEVVGTAHPEWDVRRHRYRPAWCTVAEVDPPIGDAAAISLESGAAFRRPLAQLGVGRTSVRRQRQGDDIDIDAAVEARVDRLAGTPHEDTVYIESQRRRRDLAILVLLDVSGSAAEPGTGGRSVHEHQATVAAALTSAVHDLGDRVALYGFSSRGRSAVQLLRVKAFDDHLDGDALRRLGGLAPAAFTRLGAAIRHGTAILEARAGTPRRLLVVLSDGFAYDHGYEGRYGEADARRALVEARRRGVGCLCLSVGAETDPVALRRVFGPAAHATVPAPDQLPTLIGPLFRAALSSAEAQQRAHQRRARVRERLAVERSAR